MKFYFLVSITFKLALFIISHPWPPQGPKISKTSCLSKFSRLKLIQSIILCLLLCFLVPGCDNVLMVGNGLCNNETNNADCNYDGGDCCVVNANINSSSDCGCHFIETCAAGYHPFVGNGFCNDDTNVAECDYDGGDCCGYNINSEHCTECTCFHQETCLAGVTHTFVSDGICNDETNIADCYYDGGDCCVNVNTDSCSECNCLGGGVITSPGFPGTYDNNLDMTWLIQLQIGQLIDIHFLLFWLANW